MHENYGKVIPINSLRNLKKTLSSGFLFKLCS